MRLVCWLQEEEKRLKPGTHKSVMFTVLKTATVEGMTVQDIINKAVEMGFDHFQDAQKSSLSAVSIKLCNVHTQKRAKDRRMRHPSNLQVLTHTGYLLHW